MIDSAALARLGLPDVETAAAVLPKAYRPVRWKEGIMAESQLVLTAEEHDYLVRLLETTLKDTRIEEHRTRTPTYRQHIVQQEDLIIGVLRKLGRQPG